MRVIGVLIPQDAWVPHLRAAFVQGLAEEGYVEGKNLRLDVRITNFKLELLPEAARDLVRLNVDVIFAATPETIVPARNATTSISIVAVDLESDPLAKGYVKSPIQSNFWVRFMCPKTRRNRLRLPIVRFHPGSSCPQAAALRRSHTRGRRPPPFSARSRVSWHTVNLRSAPSSAIIRTSEHFHVFSPPPRLSVRMFGSGGKKRANASSNCAAL